MFVRPFWTDDGGSSLRRTDFGICWLKSCGVDAAALWEVLAEQYGFFGLVTNGKNLGLRITPGVEVDGMLAQVHFVAKDATAFVRRPVPGAQWWQLGPLSDAEAWHAAELVAAFGLQPLRGELRFGRSGPFRSVVYFTAAGTPTRCSLDDGSWGASAARLSAAAPPPQRPRKPPGTALSAQSTWGGPRTNPPPSSLHPATTHTGAPFSSAFPDRPWAAPPTVSRGGYPLTATSPAPPIAPFSAPVQRAASTSQFDAPSSTVLSSVAPAGSRDRKSVV